jgi:hypothetical protein
MEKQGDDADPLIQILLQLPTGDAIYGNERLF